MFIQGGTYPVASIEEIRAAVAARQWGSAARLAHATLAHQSLPVALILQIIQGCVQARLYGHALPLAEYLTRWDARNPDYWYRLGFIRRKMRDFKGANEAQQKALQLDPAHSQAQLELAKIVRDQKNSQPSSLSAIHMTNEELASEPAPVINIELEDLKDHSPPPLPAPSFSPPPPSTANGWQEEQQTNELMYWVNRAHTALVLSILSLFCCPLVLGIISLILGLQACRHLSHYTISIAKSGHSYALAAVIISIISISINLIITFMIILFWNAIWVFLLSLWGALSSSSF